MIRSIRITSKVALVCIFLVVIAGSVVRMTGSGMGCPDWPKCFGYLIPPTDEATVSWNEARTFKKGQMIVHNEQLLVATEDFTTTKSFDQSHWEVYEKHDYAVFNAAHTWTEYINRLLGALSGIPVLVLLVLTLLYIRKDWFLFFLSAATTFMLGFEAWLGKLVVDGNLIPNQITIHMMGALVIIGLLLAIMARTRKKPVSRKPVLFPFNSTLLFVLFLSLLQIVLGTQVREEVDEVSKVVAREDWIESLSSLFEIHRSFAIAVILANGILLWINRRKNYGIVLTNWIMGTIIVEIILGIVLSYAGMPPWAQPMHLFFAVVMFAFQLYLLLNLLKKPYRKPVIPKQS